MTTEIPSIKYRYGDKGASHHLDALFVPIDDVRKQVAERLAQDTENKTKKAMMEMGWNPPEIELTQEQFLRRLEILSEFESEVG